MQHEKAHPGRHGRDRQPLVGRRRARGRRGDRRRRGARGRGRRGRGRGRLLRAAGPDRQPHAHGDAVRRHALDRRLRHRHARRGGRRHHLHRRLRDPAAPGRAALLARGVERSGRRRGARGLRLPHRDHAGRRGHVRRHGADGRGGHLHVQGLPRLQGRADGHRRPVPARAREHARPERADDGPLRERLGDRRAGGARTGRRPDRPDPPRAHAPGGARGRGDTPVGAAGRARRRGRLHRARDLRAGGRRDRRRSGARRERLRRDLPAVPDQHGPRPRAAGLRGRPLRLLPAAARAAQPGAALGGARPGRARERVHRPLPVQQRAEGARPRRLLEDPERPGDDPAPAGQALGPRRGDRADHARGAGRPHLDGDRPPLRPVPQGRDRARQGRRPGRIRPLHPVRVLHPHLAHERRLRPVRGRVARRAACATRSAAASWSTTAARSAPSRVTAASCRARSGRRPRSPPDGRRPRARGPARARAPHGRAGRRPARVLDRRVGAGARVPALAPGRAAGGGGGRRRGQPLGGAGGRAGRAS